MPYPKNFAVRLIICIAGMYALWFAIQFFMDTVVRHEPFSVRTLDIIIPLVTGVIQAMSWKPKEK